MSETFNTETETGNALAGTGNRPQPLPDVQEVLKKHRLTGMSRRQKVLCLVIILIIAAGLVLGVYKWLGKSQKAEFVTTTVTRGTVTDSIEATGTLNPVKESQMGFKNDDTITAINVKPGDHVKQGQVLAQQDPSTLQTALQQAISTVEQDRLSMQSTQLSLESARKTWERQQKLFEAGALPQSDLDTAENSFKKSELELATARAKLANDQIKAEQARSDLSGAALVAPFDGIIGAVNGQVGQINGINSTTSTLLCIISEDLQMSALINEADIGRIKVGQEVEFTASAFSNQTFKGQVLRITPQAESVSNIQYYPVLISCIDPKHQLMAGMSVSANIIAARRTDVVTVPLMAISYAQSYIKNHPSSDNADKTKPSRTGARAGAQTRMAASASTQSRTIGTAATQGQPGRVVVLQNNKPIVKTVVLGLSDGSGYEVIEGLKPGDKVILGSNQFNTQSSGSSGSNSNSNGSNRNQGRVIMNGRPPGGF